MISEDVLEIAKDFTALMIIGHFDNIFGAFTTSDEVAKQILTEPEYEKLFTIETTTSFDAENRNNAQISQLWDDWVISIINVRRKKEKEEEEKYNDDYPKFLKAYNWKKPVNRPKRIRWDLSDRKGANKAQGDQTWPRGPKMAQSRPEWPQRCPEWTKADQTGPE